MATQQHLRYGTSPRLDHSDNKTFAYNWVGGRETTTMLRCRVAPQDTRWRPWFATIVHLFASFQCTLAGEWVMWAIITYTATNTQRTDRINQRIFVVYRVIRHHWITASISPCRSLTSWVDRLQSFYWFVVVTQFVSTLMYDAVVYFFVGKIKLNGVCDCCWK